MNPLHSQAAIPEEQIARLQKYSLVIAGLTHIETNGSGLGGWRIEYYESAMKIAKLKSASADKCTGMLSCQRTANQEKCGKKSTVLPRPAKKPCLSA